MSARHLEAWLLPLPALERTTAPAKRQRGRPPGLRFGQVDAQLVALVESLRTEWQGAFPWWGEAPPVDALIKKLLVLLLDEQGSGSGAPSLAELLGVPGAMGASAEAIRRRLLDRYARMRPAERAARSLIGYGAYYPPHSLLAALDAAFPEIGLLPLRSGPEA